MFFSYRAKAELQLYSRKTKDAVLSCRQRAERKGPGRRRAQQWDQDFLPNLRAGAHQSFAHHRWDESHFRNLIGVWIIGC